MLSTMSGRARVREKGADGAEIARPARRAPRARPARPDRRTGPVTRFTRGARPRRPEGTGGRGSMVKGRLAAAPRAPAARPSEFAQRRWPGTQPGPRTPKAGRCQKRGSRGRRDQAELLERGPQISPSLDRPRPQMASRARSRSRGPVHGSNRLLAGRRHPIPESRTVRPDQGGDREGARDPRTLDRTHQRGPARECQRGPSRRP